MRTPEIHSTEDLKNIKHFDFTGLNKKWGLDLGPKPQMVHHIRLHLHPVLMDLVIWPSKNGWFSNAFVLSSDMAWH